MRRKYTVFEAPVNRSQLEIWPLPSSIPSVKMIMERNILLENLIVIHDEMDWPVGTVRVSFNATAAGHNGVRSIADNCGGKGFVRVRVGIEKPRSKDGVIDYVLSKFSRSEWPTIIDVIAKSPTVVRTIVCDGLIAAQEMFNRKVAKD